MKNYRMGITILTTLFFIIGVYDNPILGQMQRERAVTDGPVDEMFWAPHLAGTATVQNLGTGTLNVTIMHTFLGIATDDAINNFFGIDGGANVRLGLDYGISDAWSFGIGRTTINKLVDFRTKISLLRQTTSGSVPISLAVKGDLGIITQQNGFTFRERLNYFGSVMAAHKFDSFTLQVSPMVAHFNTVPRVTEENNLFAVALGGEYRLNERFAVMAEYVPVLGNRSQNTLDALTVGLNIETGGHVFQIFFSSTFWHLEQYMMLNNRDAFWEGDFRLGFNVNRVFGLW